MGVARFRVIFFRTCSLVIFVSSRSFTHPFCPILISRFDLPFRQLVCVYVCMILFYLLRLLVAHCPTVDFVVCGFGNSNCDFFVFSRCFLRICSLCFCFFGISSHCDPTLHSVVLLSVLVFKCADIPKRRLIDNGRFSPTRDGTWRRRDG